MHVLVIDGYPFDHQDRGVAGAVVETLTAGGHSVESLVVAESQNGLPMSETQHRAYHETDNQITAEIKVAAKAIGRSDALVFCYPTITFTVPAPLKAWIEKSFLPGVGFFLDEGGRIRPGMQQIVRIGVVTTSPHSRRDTLRAGDAGRRTILRALRLNCHRFCRRTYLRLPAGSLEYRQVRRRFSRW